VAYRAGRDREPVGLSGSIHVPQGGSTTDHGASGDRIDRHVAHRTEIDLETTLDNAVPSSAVCSTAYRNLQVSAPSEPDGGTDIAGARAPHHDRGTPVDVSVPHGASLVVSSVLRQKYLSGYPRPQGFDIRTDDLCHVNLLLSGLIPRRRRVNCFPLGLPHGDGDRAPQMATQQGNVTWERQSLSL
jgi:hypothetical protein